MGWTTPEMLQARYLFSRCAYGLGSASHSNFCPPDIAPPGTAHSRFKTGSAYTCRTKQAQRQLDPPLLAFNKFSLTKLNYR